MMSRNSVFHVAAVLRDMFSAEKRPWEIWPNPPFGTPDDYCRAVTGHPWPALLQIVNELNDGAIDIGFNAHVMRTELAKAQVVHRKQGSRTDLLRSDTTKLGDRGSAYLLRRLARDHPEILAQYERGEFKSARAAAITAGIVTPLTPYQIVLRQLPKLTDEERAQFRRLLDERADCVTRNVNERTT
jgi:hypothetical protein